MDIRTAEKVVARLGAEDGALLTLHGRGDPLLHPEFDSLVRFAKDHGVAAVHVRSELRCDEATIDRVLASPVDVVSVDLHADRAATYGAMMGDDRFRDVLVNIERLLARRRRLTDHPGNAAIAIPWVVPRLLRCRATHEDIESFFDRWQAVVGCAVIEGGAYALAGRGDEVVGVSRLDPTPLASAAPPAKVVRRELLRRMLVRSDGSVPVSEVDLEGRCSVGSAAADSLDELWTRLVAARRRAFDHPSGPSAPLGIAFP